MTTAKCKHRWTDWSFHGPKRVMQVRSCWNCPALQQRKSPAIRKGLDLENVAAYLSNGWKRYVKLFGVPPNGTVLQFLALLELSCVDDWQTLKGESKSPKVMK